MNQGHETFQQQMLLHIIGRYPASVNAYIRTKTLGKSLKDKYLQLIEERLKLYGEDEIMTLKELLGIHWQYLSKAEKKYLVSMVLEAIEEEELPLDVFQTTKNGKYKFVKAVSISNVFKDFKDTFIEHE